MCLGDVVPLGELEGDAEAAEEDGDVGAGARKRPGVHGPRGLLLRDGGELLERRRDPPQRLVRLARPHRRACRSRSPTSGAGKLGGEGDESFFPPLFLVSFRENFSALPFGVATRPLRWHQQLAGDDAEVARCRVGLRWAGIWDAARPMTTGQRTVLVRITFAAFAWKKNH